MDDRVENDLFFAAVARRHGPPSIDESVFYAGRPRPAPERTLAQIAASTPMRYGLAIFALGWASVLFQRSFLQQLVFGAPVFEELAKLGPAIVVVTLLRLRSPLARVPVAWLSGAAFGVIEHFLTYADEDPVSLAIRIAFHAGSTALSILLYTAIEHAPDVRSRWASTLVSSLLHWANNFGGLVLGLLVVFVGALEPVASAWPLLITTFLYVAIATALLWRGPFEALALGTLHRAAPRLGLQEGDVQ